MNQILSVELPKSKKRQREANGKASTKSVLIFFSIMLIIFGIAIIALGIFKLKQTQNNQVISSNPQTTSNSTIRIDATQNGTIVDVEVISDSEITAIDYTWNDGQAEQYTVDGRKNTNFEIKIPGGLNNLKITAVNANGDKDEFTHSYKGQEEANAELSFNPETSKLTVVCTEEKTIKTLEYKYDEEEAKTTEINNTSAEVEIPIKEGEHTLSVKVTFEDGTSKSKENKIYFPVVKVITDGNNFIINATDDRTITKATINFNGQEKSADINSKTFNISIPLKDGENRLIVTMQNADNATITKRILWKKE